MHNNREWLGTFWVFKHVICIVFYLHRLTFLFPLKFTAEIANIIRLTVAPVLDYSKKQGRSEYVVCTAAATFECVCVCVRHEYALVGGRTFGVSPKKMCV